MIVNPLVGKQRQANELATAAGNLYEGAVRSSKTVCSLLRWLRFVRQAPAGDLLMIGKTERTLDRNIIGPLMSMLGPRRMTVTRGLGECSILGRKIYLTGANNVAAADKIRGMTLIGWYGDELSTWPEEVFDIADTRLSLAGAKWFGTTNPGPPTHWLYKRHMRHAKLHLDRDGTIKRRTGDDVHDLHVFSFTLDDNPALGADYLRRLKRQYHGVFYDRSILGKWVSAEGAIYSAWDPRYNVITMADVPPLTAWLSTGVDYGTINPFHAVLIGIGEDIRGDGAALYVTSEYRYDQSEHHGRQLEDRQYADGYLSWLAGTEVPAAAGARGAEPMLHCVDPSAASFRTTLANRGTTTRGAYNDVINGLRLCTSAVANRKLYVVDTCGALIEEIPSYAWDPVAAERGEERPLKVNDHGCDGLRYGVATPRQLWLSEVYA